MKVLFSYQEKQYFFLFHLMYVAQFAVFTCDFCSTPALPVICKCMWPSVSNLRCFFRQSSHNFRCHRGATKTMMAWCNSAANVPLRRDCQLSSIANSLANSITSIPRGSHLHVFRLLEETGAPRGAPGRLCKGFTWLAASNPEPSYCTIFLSYIET